MVHDGFTNIGTCQRRLGHYQEAIKSYRHALRLSENFEPAVEGLLATYFDQSAYQEVRSFLKSISQKLMKSDLVIYHTGLLNLRENDLSSAENIFQKLEKSKKYWPRCLINLALIAESRNELDEAVDYLKQASVTGFQRSVVRYTLECLQKTWSAKSSDC